MRLFFGSKRVGPADVTLAIQNENARRWEGDREDAGIYVGNGKAIICHPSARINGIELDAADLLALLREVVASS